MKNFIIYGLARSGTSNLAAALANGKLNDKVVQEPFLKKTGDTQRFRWLAELQNEFGFFPKNVLGGDGCVFSGGQLNTNQFLDKLYEKAVGVKHVFSSVPNAIVNAQLINYVASHNIKVIFLRRRNIFDSAVSSVLACQHGFWGWRENVRDILDNFKYEPIDINLVLETAEAMYNARCAAELEVPQKVIKENLLSFYYEDLYSTDRDERHKNFDAICDFIELDRSDLLEDVVCWQFLNDNKQNKNSNLSRVSNYKEILNLYELYPHLA